MRPLLGLAVRIGVLAQAKDCQDRLWRREEGPDLLAILDVLAAKLSMLIRNACLLKGKRAQHNEQRPQDGQQHVVGGVRRQGPVEPQEPGRGGVADQAVGERALDDLVLRELALTVAVLAGAKNVVRKGPEKTNDEDGTKQHDSAGDSPHRSGGGENIPASAVADRLPCEHLDKPRDRGDRSEERALDRMLEQAECLLGGCARQAAVCAPPQPEVQKIVQEVVDVEWRACRGRLQLAGRHIERGKMERHMRSEVQWVVEQKNEPEREDGVGAQEGEAREEVGVRVEVRGRGGLCWRHLGETGA
eukprot:m.238065 g.238065  ORF g.238065 m.238065 type:complete len:303 (+) comp13241_c0_seq1:70-978(+)